jgi:acetoin utilization deacetylase AcuC-like enzyme
MVKRAARRSFFFRKQAVGPETYTSFHSHETLLRAQSAWLDAVDDASAAVWPLGVRVSWALTRPPGHHAGKSTAEGFCVYNFCAAATEYALRTRDWVVVLDWDVHHGT